MPSRRASLVALVSTVVFVGLLIAVVAGALGAGSVDARSVTSAHAAVRDHPLLLSLARALTNLGAPVVVDALAAVAGVVLWLTGRRRASLYVLAVRVAALVLDSAFKDLVGRSRPVLADPVAHASGFSFPSGHATGAASVYLPLAALANGVLVRRGARIVVMGVAVLACLVVATTRVLLGVHYPSDVLAGLALGTAVTCAVSAVMPARPRS